MEKESRCFKSELRALQTEDGKTVVRGYALKFNSLSENLGGFREQILPGAADDVLGDDVRALMNHDSNLVLGRTKSGTLRMGTDEVGVWYEYDDPGTSYSRDLLISMQRGDIDQSSFQFTLDKEGEQWEQREDGTLLRTISKFKRFYDVSPVTFPAYPDTTVAKRSLEQYTAAAAPEITIPTGEIEARQRQIALLNLKK